MYTKEKFRNAVFEVVIVILVLGIFVGLGHRIKKIEGNSIISKTDENNVIETINLVSVTGYNRLITISGTSTDNPKLDYWFETDNTIRAGSVPRANSRLVYIGEDEIPHMDTLIIITTTEIKRKRFLGKGIKVETETHQSEEIYVFYIPERSISEK